jgi:hypothetical protein
MKKVIKPVLRFMARKYNTAAFTTGETKHSIARLVGRIVQTPEDVRSRHVDALANLGFAPGHSQECLLRQTVVSQIFDVSPKPEGLLPLWPNGKLRSVVQSAPPKAATS